MDRKLRGQSRDCLEIYFKSKRPLVLYTWNEEAITLMYGNITFFFFLTKGQNGCMRERERESQLDREPLRYDIFRFTPGGDTFL